MEVNRYLPRTAAYRPTTTTPFRRKRSTCRRVRRRALRTRRRRPRPTGAAIARHALTYVQRRSTLQTGSAPSRTSWRRSWRGPLGDRHPLRMFTTGLMRLHRPARSQRRQGDVRRRVGDHLRVGRGRALPMAGRNARWRSSPSTRSTTRRSSPRNANLVSINGALSVDLYGQVMADSIDGHRSRVSAVTRIVVGGRAAPRRPFAHLPAFDDRAGRRARCPHSGASPEGTVVSTHAITPASSSPNTAQRSSPACTVRERAHLLVDIAPGLPPGSAQGGRWAREGLISVQTQRAGQIEVVEGWRRPPGPAR